MAALEQIIPCVEDLKTPQNQNKADAIPDAHSEHKHHRPTEPPSVTKE